jgi:hypothetical protein
MGAGGGGGWSLPLAPQEHTSSRTQAVTSDPLGPSQFATRTQHVKGCASGGVSTATLDLPPCERPLWP